MTIKVKKAARPAIGRVEKFVGIDLRLKEFEATSYGYVISLGRHYHKLEQDLAKAQRARKKARVRALHAKIRNARRDQLRKLSTALVQEHGAIFIGNMNASPLAKTRMAKSVLDAGCSLFRTMPQ
ncbi:transposase [Paraburkholderia xenovorans]|uniref:transposase n=1 Tax=Paraburkholderia xenovorans TaxID=36873 RepID=UPI0038BD1C7C